MIRAMLKALMVFLAAIAAPLALAQEVAFTNRSTDLREQASPDARAVATLRENTELRVTQRASGWARAETGGQSGWVRIFHIRFPAVAQAGTSSGVSGALSSITSAVSGRSATQSSTLATTGIRGLSSEELKNANPDPEALRRMQSFRADRPGAERFAPEGKPSANAGDAAGERR